MKPPADFGLPYDRWRPGQTLAIRTAQFAKTPHVVIQAPTGSGKSAIATTLSQIDSRRAAILTATNHLSDQYLVLSPVLHGIRGMANYPCIAAPREHRKYFPLRNFDKGAVVMCDDGMCRGGVSCTAKADGCLYFDAVRAAFVSSAIQTNYKYWLSMRRYAAGLGAVQLLLCDEAHALPEELMDACSLEFTPSQLQDAPKSLNVRPGVWQRWAQARLHELTATDTSDERQRAHTFRERLKQLTEIDRTWAWDRTRTGSMIFAPTIPRLLLPYLTTAGEEYSTEQAVYLSATITPATLAVLGVKPTETTFLRLTSRFPRERRPVYVLSNAPYVKWNMTADDIDAWIDLIDRIIDRRLDRKGLIHCKSYLRQETIRQRSRHRDRFIVPTSTRQLAQLLPRFRAAGPGAILISPSVHTGLDFPRTDAEYQIITKVPFVDTRSRIMKARCAATSGYQELLVMTELIQAAGRIMRADDDQGETFIVDGMFGWFWKKHDDLAPDWFTESLVWTRRAPYPPPRLEAA